MIVQLDVHLFASCLVPMELFDSYPFRIILSDFILKYCSYVMSSATFHDSGTPYFNFNLT